MAHFSAVIGQLPLIIASVFQLLWAKWRVGIDQLPGL